MQSTPPPALPHLIPLAKIRETPQAIWYRARQTRLSREVLLKMRPIGKTPGEGRAVTRAREEMLLLGKLHSDGVVAALDIDAVGGWLYQMVELPPGSPLTRLFQERGKAPWPDAEALAIARSLAGTLDHAHKAGIVLRRLHPEDIFLAPDGRVKIASLEWATAPGVSPPLPPDQNWLAPEVTGGGTATPASDLHALGNLLTWLLTGREPPSSGLRRSDEKALEALRARGAREEITSLVASLLDPVPQSRPASGVRVAEAILEIEGQLGRRRGLSRRALALSAAAAVALAAVILIAALVPNGETVYRSSVRSGLFGKSEAKQPSKSLVDGATSASPVPRAGPEKKQAAPPAPAPAPLPEAPAAPDPARDAQAALEKELAAISTDFQAAPTSWPRALAAAEAFLTKKPADALRKQAETLMEEIRSDWRNRGEAAVDEFRSRDLPPLLSEKSFSAAMSLLDKLAERFPGEATRVQTLRAEILAGEREAARALETEVEALLAAGEPEKAERTAGEGTGRLTPPLNAEARERLRERIATRKKALADAAARGNTLLERSRGLLRELRFDEAGAALESVPASPELAERLAALRREIKLARAAREAVEAGLDRAVAARSTLRARVLSADGETPGPEQELVVDGREAWTLTAHRKGTTAQLRLPVQDLDAAALEALAAPVTEAAAFREGLVVLLLALDRPETAASFLDGEKLPAEARTAYAGRLLEGRARRLGELSADLERRAGELAARRGSGDGWLALRDSAARLVTRHGHDPFYDRHRAQIEKTFLSSAREVLREKSPEGLFHGHVLRERREAMVRVAYDFRDPAQVLDWSPVGKDSRMVLAGEAIRLEGSMRFTQGNPFVGRFRASVVLPGGRTYRDPPLVGVVLGSRNAAPAPGEKSPPPPGLAFVLGYQSLEGMVQVPSDPLPVPVSTPANGLFTCAGLFPTSDDVVWAAPAGRPAGAILMQAELAPSHLLWTLNSKPVISSLPETVARALARIAPADPARRIEGSVSVYTGGEPLLIDTIEVGGVLEERWLEERLDGLAREELARLSVR